VTIYIGNSEIVSEFVYDNSECLVDIIATIKQIQGVNRVMWSEEIIKLSQHKEKVMKSFNKYWNNNSNRNHYNKYSNFFKKNHNNLNNNNNNKPKSNY
jgi:hypothetical protein